MLVTQKVICIAVIFVVYNSCMSYVNKRIADSLDEAGWIALREKWKSDLYITNLAAQAKHKKDIESLSKKQSK